MRVDPGALADQRIGIKDQMIVEQIGQLRITELIGLDHDRRAENGAIENAACIAASDATWAPTGRIVTSCAGSSSASASYMARDEIGRRAETRDADLLVLEIGDAVHAGLAIEAEE